MRNFVSVPKNCEFSNELMTILNSYTELIKKFKASSKQPKIEYYDFDFFKKLIPHSCLAKEFYKFFIELPSNAYLNDGELVNNI